MHGATVKKNENYKYICNKKEHKNYIPSHFTSRFTAFSSKRIQLPVLKTNRRAH